MIIGGILDIYSRTAHQMLWNGVYMNIGLVSFWCLTILARKAHGHVFFY